MWDHDALCAVLPINRYRYKSKIATLLKPGGRILISLWEYGERKSFRDPFSLTSVEVKDLFKDEFDIELLETSYAFLLSRQRSM